MTTKHKILAVLQEQPGVTISGGKIAADLGLSRTAVWKQIAALQEDGYQICSVPNKGYLLEGGDVYSAFEISRLCTAERLRKEIVFLDSIDSTNTHAKRLAAQGAPADTVVVAAHQTGGRGRLSRSFSSPDGAGVYMTLILRPSCSISEINNLTLLTAVAVSDAVEELTDIRPTIKWTNDVYMNGKKLCGILTECSIEGESGAVEYAVVGAGVNLTQNEADFPEEIRSIATSVFAETGKLISRALYAATYLKHFERWYYGGNFPENQSKMIAAYRKALFFLGKPVSVITMQGSYPGIALDVDNEGRLLVEKEDGTVVTLNSGEISIKPI